ncbi:MAG: hypothetical protein DWQ34_10930 [Planctomycetota bacterium]|nr:MAG: hypothetical protein DWQ34_10930 [Planctomycetota bacterium]REK25408.1 MAG: hypothetical protein DWQ41_12075 [Planctomycetota bacterium]REK38024.1 MAG: hypothetical protein DWQ45_05100 [Planctomycetota bacterium]
MALRCNHYDLAFEAYLRSTRRPYVAVDEAKRAVLSDRTLKSLDFIVYSDRGRNLLVDVKGRKFPSGANGAGVRWENWATSDDLSSLRKWEEVFGPDFRAALVFAYEITSPRYESQHGDLWAFRRKAYAFYAVWADDYCELMRSRSPSWETVSLPLQEFARVRQPISDVL